MHLSVDEDSYESESRKQITMTDWVEQGRAEYGMVYLCANTVIIRVVLSIIKSKPT